MKKVIYISLPISGRPIEEVKKRAGDLKHRTYSLFPEASVATPFDMEKFYSLPEDGISYGDWMGIDIGFILNEATSVLFASDWQDSKGCQLENAAAYIYQKEILNEKDLP